MIINYECLYLSEIGKKEMLIANVIRRSFRIFIVISITSVHRVYGGGGGQGLPYAFFSVDADALHFHTGSLKIDVFKVLFWEEGMEGVPKKSTLCMLWIMLTIQLFHTGKKGMPIASVFT